MFWITLISKPIFNATQDLGSNIYLTVPVIEHKMLQYKITVITLNSDVVQRQTAQQMLDDNSISVESNVAYSTVPQNKNILSLREKLTVNVPRDEANIRCTNLSAISEVDTEANVAYNTMMKRVSYQ